MRYNFLFLVLCFKLAISQEFTVVDQLLSECKMHLQSQPEKVLKLADSAYSISNKIDYKKGQIMALRYSANSNFYVGENKKALMKYNKMLTLSYETQDSSSIGLSYYLRGITYQALGEYAESSINHSKALNYLSKNEEIRIKTLRQLGKTYWHLNLDEQSKLYFLECLELAQKMRDSANTAKLLTDLGNYHVKKGNMTEAKEYFEKAIPISTNSLSMVDKYNVNESFANYFIEQNQLEQAIFYANNASKEQEKGLSIQRARTALLFGKIYFKEHNIPKAELHLLQAEKYAKEMNERSTENKVSFYLAKLYKQLENYKKANSYLERNKQLNDSINSTRSMQTLATINAQYQTEKNNKEAITKNLINEKQHIQYRTIVFITFAQILVLVILIVYLGQRQRLKLKKENIRTEHLSDLIEGGEKEKQVIGDEILDKIGANLASLKYQISVNHDSDEKMGENELIEIIDSTIDNLRVIANRLAPATIKMFSLTEILQEYCLEMNQSHKQTIQFSCNRKLPKLSAMYEMAIYRIVEDFLEKRLAIASEISLSLNLQEDILILQIDDNGKAIEELLSPDTVSRIELLKATYIQNNKNNKVSNVFRIDLKNL